MDKYLPSGRSPQELIDLLKPLIPHDERNALSDIEHLLSVWEKH